MCYVKNTQTAVQMFKADSAVLFEWGRHACSDPFQSIIGYLSISSGSCNKTNLLLSTFYVLFCCGVALLFLFACFVFAFYKHLIENKRQVFRHRNKMILFSAGVFCPTVSGEVVSDK